MQGKQNFENLLKKLPYGSINLLADKSKCSRQAVSKFFKGELRNINKINAITKEVAKLLVELKKNRENLLNI